MTPRQPWRGNRQTISWFVDLYRRELLELDPPYQRRSVWNQRYREDFIETVLLGYPAPSLFLYEEIGDDGSTTYSVVDGKQRLTTLFAFVEGEFATRDESNALPSAARGQYFKDLDGDLKQWFWSYEFTVEYLPSTDDALLTEVFDRINRNVAKLTRQELRHARYGEGAFARAVDELDGEMTALIGTPSFPRIVESSRRQMKDIEFVVTLALLIENGPESTSQDDLDAVYAARDEEWENQTEVAERLRAAFRYIGGLLEAEPDIAGTRLRNQGDFYALVGAIDALANEDALPDPTRAAPVLQEFANKATEGPTADDESARRYYEAARAAANDTRQREARIEILEGVLRGID